MRHTRILLACLASLPLTTLAAAHKIECGSFEGFRLDYSSSPAAPLEFRQQLAKSDATNANLKVRLTWNDVDSPARMFSVDKPDPAETDEIEYALLKVDRGAYTGFVGRQKGTPDNDAFAFISYFPETRRLIWSEHSSQYQKATAGAHGRLLIGTCTALAETPARDAKPAARPASKAANGSSGDPR